MANFTTEIIEKAKGAKTAHELLELAKAGFFEEEASFELSAGFEEDGDSGDSTGSSEEVATNNSEDSAGFDETASPSQPHIKTILKAKSNDKILTLMRILLPPF